MTSEWFWEKRRLNVGMSEFVYNSFPESICNQVIDSFRSRKGQIPSITAELPISEASIYRLLNAAVQVGVLSPEERRPAYLKQQVIYECFERYPNATIAVIADMAGVSESTVYRAKRRMKK